MPPTIRRSSSAAGADLEAEGGYEQRRCSSGSDGGSDDISSRPCIQTSMRSRMRVGSIWMLPLLLLLLLLLLLATGAESAWSFEAASDPCAGVPARDPESVTQIALLFHGPPPPHPLASLQRWGSRSPLLDGWNASTTLEQSVLRSWLLFQERMESAAAGHARLQTHEEGLVALQLLDGSRMLVNFTYFNVGPLGVVYSMDEYSDNAQNSSANKLIRQLADPDGPYGRFHFLLPAMESVAIPILVAMACEETKACIAVGAICDTGDAIQRDCLARGRLPGARRFHHLLSSYNGVDWWGQALLELLANRSDRSVRRIYMLVEDWAPHIAERVTDLARHLGMSVVASQTVVSFSEDWSHSNTSVEALTASVRHANVDQVLVISSLRTPVLAQLVAHWKDVGFTPYALAWIGGGYVHIPRNLRSFILIETGWLPTLSGANYRSFSSDIHLELFPSNATHDSPAVFAAAFESRFGRVLPPTSGWLTPIRGYHAINIVQQLLEWAQTDHIDALLDASVRIATPGVYHAIQFDQWGRTQLSRDFVLQTMPDNLERILTPLGLGQPPILPMPTWEERVFAPGFYEHNSERIMLGLVCFAILYLLFWFAWAVKWWQHPVLRASAPAFSAAALFGLVLMLVSNMLNSLHATNATCAVSFFLWTGSFNLSFGALLLKNLRIWALWHNRAHDFAPSRLRQSHLAAALVLLLLVDVAINLQALLVGELGAERIVVDPYRPSHDVMRCVSLRFGLAALQVAFKSAVLLSGLVLAWKLRNVSSQFSESYHIALSVYNACVAVGVLIVLLVMDVGGSTGNVLIRNYCTLYLGVSTATIMAAPKLFAIQAAEAERLKAVEARKAAIAAAAAAAGGGIIHSHPDEAASFQLPVLPPPDNAAQRYGLAPNAGPRDAAAVAAALVANLKQGATPIAVTPPDCSLRLPAGAHRPGSDTDPNRSHRTHSSPSASASGPPPLLLLPDGSLALQLQMQLLQQHGHSSRDAHSSLLRAAAAMIDTENLPDAALLRLEEALRRRCARNGWRPVRADVASASASPSATPSVVQPGHLHLAHPVTPSRVTISPTRVPLLAASPLPSPQASDGQQQQQQQQAPLLLPQRQLHIPS